MKNILLIYTNTNKRSKTRNAILTFFIFSLIRPQAGPSKLSKKRSQVKSQSLTGEEPILHR